MRALIVVSICTFVATIYFQGSNGTLSNEERISYSLVSIVCENDDDYTRIQTAVYNHKLGVIFTLYTERIGSFSRAYVVPDTKERRIEINRCSRLWAINGQRQQAQIFSDNEKTRYVLSLKLHSQFQPIFADPLPFGHEVYNAVAEIAGWAMNDRYIITPPAYIEKGADNLIHIYYDDTFMENCKIEKTFYDIRPSDLLIQGNKIIGFLKEINAEKNLIIFYPASSIVKLNESRSGQNTNEHDNHIRLFGYDVFMGSSSET